MNRPSVLLIPILFYLFSSCAYYNTFYNAEKSYDDAEKIIEETKKKDNEDIPQQAKKLLDLSIEKSRKVIEEYSDSKYVDDAFYLIGKSSFKKGDYQYAEKHFRQLLNEYPQSKFNTEAKIWLAYTYLRMNVFDSTIVILNNIEKMVEQLDNNHNHLMYMIKGDMALMQDSTTQAYTHFEKAIQFAPEERKKASMYENLVKIAEKNRDIKNAIYFLDKLDLFAQSDEIKHEAKLKWLRYNREMGNLDIVQSEIDKLLSRTDYEPLFLALELERAKIFLSKGDIESARENLLFIVENNSKKKETAESFYLLGLYNLQHNWDLDKAKEYFENVKLEYSRSIYKEPARELKNTINVYQGIELNFRSQQSGDTTAVQFEIEEEVKEEDIFDMRSSEFNTNFSGNMSNINMRFDDDEGEPPAKVTVKGTIDSLLFAMGEILFFDFQQLDSAHSRFQYLYNNYPESKFTPQAIYVLSRTNTDSIEWKDVLLDEYPDSEYSKNYRGDVIEENQSKSLDRKRDGAWSTLDASPMTSIETFLSIADSTNDPSDFYTIAFVNDYYINDLDNSIKYYQSYVDSFPNHEFFELAQNRLITILQSIEDTIPNENDSVRVNMDTLLFSSNEDSSSEEDIQKFYPELPPIIFNLDTIDLKSDSISPIMDTISIANDSVSKKSDTLLFSTIEDSSIENNFQKSHLELPPNSLKSDTIDFKSDTMNQIKDRIDLINDVKEMNLEKEILNDENNIKSKTTIIDSVLDSLQKNILTNNEVIEKTESELNNKWKEYLVQPGESIGSIAMSYYNNIMMSDSIYSWNSKIIGSTPALIYPFSILYLKPKSGELSQGTKYFEYKVIYGESLWTIAEKVYGNPYMWMVLFIDNKFSMKMNKDSLNIDDIILIRSSLSIIHND